MGVSAEQSPSPPTVQASVSTVFQFTVSAVSLLLPNSGNGLMMATMRLTSSLLIVVVLGGFCESCQESQRSEGCNIVTKDGVTQCVCGEGCRRDFQFEYRNECLITLMESPRCKEEGSRNAEGVKDQQTFP